MTARLVYDGATLAVPPEMGTPRADQLQGTALERLCEVAGRISYDSLGKGRTSVEFHRHILDVRHLSVYRHATITVACDVSYAEARTLALACLNRKGVHVERSRDVLEITANLQAIVEWDRYSSPYDMGSDWLGEILRRHAHRAAPMIVPAPEGDSGLAVDTTLKTTDLTDDQAHVSLYLAGSRAWSHEQIRHNYAVSQRSTRYCDEANGSMVDHPLLAQCLDGPSLPVGARGSVARVQSDAEGCAATAYTQIVELLTDYLRSRGVLLTPARKQARAAATRYLPHGLRTEMVFTAPVSGWHDILRQRYTDAADAEMRAICADALRELRASQYGDRFSHYREVPAADGIGTVLASDCEVKP